MSQFVHCNGCNNQIPRPENLDGKPSPQFLLCETCGNEFFWNGGLTDNSEPLILFSIEDAAESLEKAESLATKSDQESHSFDFDEADSVDRVSGQYPSEEADQPIESELRVLEHPENVQVQVEEFVSGTSHVQAPEQLPSEQSVPDETYYESGQSAQAETFQEIPVAEQVVLLEAAPTVDWSVLGPAVPRQRPKEVSAIRKIIPPVLGGLAALPIATLILWYGFGKDIGTTGPTVAKYVPWIVPEKFRRMPFETSPSNNTSKRIASGRPQRSAPSARGALPTLNREETNLPPKESSEASVPIIAMEIIAIEKPNAEPEKPTSLAQPKTNTSNESTLENISEIIVALRLLQIEMRNAKAEGKTSIFVDCQSKLKELSKQAFDLTGPSSRMWNKQLEAISREILADPEIPRAMEKVANKARREIAASVSGDFVATVIKVGEANDISSSEAWVLREKWPTDDGAIPIEVLPGAWRAGSATLPATCMVFGRLLPEEDTDAGPSNTEATGSSLVLKVHLLVPKSSK